MSQEFGLKNVKMFPYPIDSEKKRRRVEPEIRHHILFDEDYTYYWFNQFIDGNEITEIDASESDKITDDDIVLYHIDGNKNVTFKTITEDLSYSTNGIIGILKGAQSFKENKKNGS